MKMMVRLTVLIGLFIVIGLSEAAAQDNSNKDAKYRGSLNGQCRGLIGTAVEVDIRGGIVKGNWKNQAGSTSRFEGALQDNKFNIIRTASNGNHERFSGTIAGDKLELSFEQGNCRYRSSMNKEAV